MRLNFKDILIFCLILQISAGFMFAEEENSDGLGFWQISPSEFQAGEPFILQEPVPGKTTGFCYVWPFSFKCKTSLNNVLNHLKQQLAQVRNDSKKEEMLQRSIQKVENELKGEFPKLRFFISLYTETDKSYNDISSSLIRNMAERRLHKKLLTVSDIASADLTEGETVDGVAIFQDVDPEADKFEIRVMGLGKRIVPSYYPGHILKAGLPYKAKLRKALRFAYERPGDAATRAAAKVTLVSRTNEWVWLWANEIYPMRSQAFTLERSIDGDDGETKLVYNFKYFPYEIFNSTPDKRSISVKEAGISVKVKWQGMPLYVNIVEDAEKTDFRKSQALKKLKEMEPDYFAEGNSRHVNGEIEPGKKASGIALIRWGINNPQKSIASLIESIRIAGVGAAEKDESKLISRYRELLKSGSGKQNGVISDLSTVSDDDMANLVLSQAKEDLEAEGISIDKSEKTRYGEYAPFAVFINSLAEKELERMKESGRMPVYFAAKIGQTTDSARFERLTDIGRPVEGAIDTSISTDVAVDTAAPGAGGFFGGGDSSGGGTTDDSGGKKDSGTATEELNADELW